MVYQVGLLESWRVVWILSVGKVCKRKRNVGFFLTIYVFTVQTTRTHVHIVVLLTQITVISSLCFKKNAINELVGPHTRHLLPPPGQVVVLRELQ